MSAKSADSDFEQLIEYIKQSRGFDFTGYKRSSLMRRVTKRMQGVGIENYNDYQDYLEIHQEEFIHLFNTLLINVTTFFRDRVAWDFIADEIVPRILSTKEPNEIIRLWSAGCASGQEAYTLAMIFAEKLGFDQFRDRVKIFATDIDEEALNQARSGSYNAKEIEEIPEPLLSKYFEVIDNRCTFRKDLQRSIIFGRNNLVQDAPISRIDLLVCRNTLMYFNAETQLKILARFHFALNNGGVLFLGKAETLLSQSQNFTPIDLKRRIFAQVQRGNSRNRLLMLAQGSNGDLSGRFNHVKLRESAFDAGPIAQVLVSFNGIMVLANERSRILFGLSFSDIGRPLQDLELSYRPFELRSCIEQAYAERRSIVLENIEWSTPSGQHLYLEAQVMPLSDNSGNLLGVNITFNDVSAYKNLQIELEQTKQELEVVSKELQSTNEELETTYEELQSTNEELETTNEELQSTNEELETMNEELQSTNEELQTINDELSHHSEQLNYANSFLESIVTSLRCGVVVINQNLKIRIWNHKMEDLWGLRSEEVLGQYFLNLDLGLPMEQLRQPIRSCLNTEEDYQIVVLEATNRRGKQIQCKVTCTPLIDGTKNIEGAIILIEEAR
jgi:two-component system CheB/CheR fusion protein